VIGAEPEGPGVVALGAPADATTYAHDLYRMLRDADAQSLDLVLAVVPDGPDGPDGLAAAVADRLHRAATP
jgi:hypothetical protein